MQNIVTLIANVKEQKLDENILNKGFCGFGKKISFNYGRKMVGFG